MLRPLRVALDWTPNTNHTGLYVARRLGLYRAAGLDVHFILPTDTAAQGLTPARLCAAGGADLAVGPSETAVSFATTDSDRPRLCAVATLLQGSTSAICTLQSSGIDRPSLLAGKRYASYDGRFEDAIVRRMVATDGGDAQAVRCHSLPSHAYLEETSMQAGSVVASMLQRGLSDSTWIFTHWEGVLAERSAQQLHYFRLEDYAIPYGYSPILLCHPSTMAQQSGMLRQFLQASAEGYRIASTDSVEAAAMLCAEAGHESLADVEFVTASQQAIGDLYLTEGCWGHMQLSRWQAFVDFLAESGILVDREGAPIARENVPESQLFTNEFLV